jgi:hypothetical protein
MIDRAPNSIIFHVIMFSALLRAINPLPVQSTRFCRLGTLCRCLVVLSRTWLLTARFWNAKLYDFLVELRQSLGRISINLHRREHKFVNLFFGRLISIVSFRVRVSKSWWFTGLSTASLLLWALVVFGREPAISEQYWNSHSRGQPTTMQNYLIIPSINYRTTFCH